MLLGDTIQFGKLSVGSKLLAPPFIIRHPRLERLHEMSCLLVPVYLLNISERGTRHMQFYGRHSQPLWATFPVSIQAHNAEWVAAGRRHRMNLDQLQTDGSYREPGYDQQKFCNISRVSWSTAHRGSGTVLRITKSYNQDFKSMTSWAQICSKTPYLCSETWPALYSEFPWAEITCEVAGLFPRLVWSTGQYVFGMTQWPDTLRGTQHLFFSLKGKLSKVDCLCIVGRGVWGHSNHPFYLAFFLRGCSFSFSRSSFPSSCFSSSSLCALFRFVLVEFLFLFSSYYFFSISSSFSSLFPYLCSFPQCYFPILFFSCVVPSFLSCLLVSTSPQYLPLIWIRSLYTEGCTSISLRVHNRFYFRANFTITPSK